MEVVSILLTIGFNNWAKWTLKIGIIEINAVKIQVVIPVTIDDFFKKKIINKITRMGNNDRAILITTNLHSLSVYHFFSNIYTRNKDFTIAKPNTL